VPIKIDALMSAMVAMLVFGLFGQKLAKTYGRNHWLGFAVGAFLPLIGVGILLYLGPKKRSFREDEDED